MGKPIFCAACSKNEAELFDGLEFLCYDCAKQMEEDRAPYDQDSAGHRDQRVESEQDLGGGS